ncbi:hypothetical protein HDU89_003329 [Geranomyces variabilis]|nr:hypothetical protein HDU89_003329 [Geranomyces variabilis]
MCRWFAYCGIEPTLLEDILVRPRHSIVKQIDEHFLPGLKETYSPHTHKATVSAAKASDTQHNPNPLTNIDGFGVGYYLGATAEFNENGVQIPTVYRNTRPALNDLNFKSLCETTATKCAFCHIRAGTGLTPTVETNNHPFRFGRHLFMHNGVLANFKSIKVALLQKLSRKAFENVLGTTDSEHVAALFFTHLGDDWNASYSIQDLKTAMIATLRDLIALVRTSGKAGDVPPSSLNFAVTDGNVILAQRFSSHSNREPPSLYYSTVAGVTLNRKFPDHPDGPQHAASSSETATKSKKPEEHGKHVIIASEPNTYKEQDWNLVPRNSFVLVDSALDLSIEAIPADLVN